MKKIPTLFVRNPDDRRYVTEEVTPGCEWVLTGYGRPTRKYDGTCVMRDQEGGWYARREIKPGKTPPDGFWPEQHDEVTGKTVGWEPIGSSPFVKFFDEAIRNQGHDLPPGTYELIGPKINGDPEGEGEHALVRHEDAETIDSPRSFAGLAEWLPQQPYEGIVWHHPDGRMAKLKARDFPKSTS